MQVECVQSHMQTCCMFEEHGVEGGCFIFPCYMSISERNFGQGL